MTICADIWGWNLIPNPISPTARWAQFTQWRTYHPTNNIAKNVIDFSIAVPRERLRPKYGDGFKGAPLGTSPPSQRISDQNRGANRNEPQTPNEEEVDRASEV
jgi:hypothetical protein